MVNILMVGTLCGQCSIWSTQNMVNAWSTQVKAYVVRQFSKILAGRVSVQDFVFAKEVRLGTYVNESTRPPAAVVATQAMILDKRWVFLLFIWVYLLWVRVFCNKCGCFCCWFAVGWHARECLPPTSTCQYHVNTTHPPTTISPQTHTALNLYSANVSVMWWYMGSQGPALWIW